MVDKFDYNKIGNISRLENQVVGDAEGLKSAFDQNAKAIAEYINGTLVPAIDGKLSPVPGKGLSSNDFTNDLLNKLNGIAEGAEVNAPVDQGYEPNSKNAQSGTAVAEAIYEAVSKLVNGAPEAYDTLLEIYNKLKDDDDAINGIINTLAGKVDKVQGKGLSTNDFTNEDKKKLESIPANLSQLSDDIGVEKTSNRVNSISDDDTTTTYPSVQAVINFVRMENQGLVDTLRFIGLSYFVDDTNTHPISQAHWASEASHDEFGNNIAITYATKTELAEAIGEALEGDY